ncbi:glycoside hydrolase family 2 TIM barrel-domain containing protein [Microbacterium sp. NPDC079995]|uniref:glycoside hydrolase family 2 protein n=1 Tax=unclassified Microbacterium TaxID=2609290 RepID=UPI00344D5638
MSDASLDEVERRRWRQSPLWGDRWVEAHAALTSHPATAVELGASAVPEAADEVLSLDGEWLMAGASPGREFSIDRWAGDRSNAAQRRPVSWHREDTDRSSWVRATVPGTVQSALVDAGVTPDPLTDDHTFSELTAHGEPSEWPWFFRRTRIEQQEWWYARRFEAPAHWLGRRVRLSFDGIDYAASVYVNGQPVARHTGMFGGPDVEVGALLRPGDTNEVVVRIDPPPRDWHGVMKPSPGWGWHYGHLISMGIWRGVTLTPVPDIELTDLAVTVHDASEDVARLRISWDAVNPTAERAARSARLVVRDPGGRSLHTLDASFEAPAGVSRHHIEMTVDRPQLWWPFGYGAQPLYRAEVGDGDGDTTLQTSFGIRTVRMAALPRRHGPDTYDWQFVVNGRPVFLKGANWCWTDPMARRGFEVDRHILDLVVRANLQMLRAWGGGTVESDEFYEECDRRGILVLQEFPLTFGLDATGADLATIDEQASRIVRRLRNHPSLIMWGGGNENPATSTSDDLLTVIGKRVTQYDPSRPFHRTDPWGGSEHFYGVYHEGMPIEAYADLLPAVFGEYGLSSQCSLESMGRFLDPTLLEQWPPHPHGALLQHQSQFSLFDLFKQARYAAYGPITDWRTFIEYSQIAQGDALRFASERIRAHSGAETAGYWFYKVGEAFPGASWAVIDYYGVPKLSYYRAKQFSAPRSAFAVYDRTEWAADDVFEAGVHVANDTPVALQAARVRATLFDAQWSVLFDQERTVDVEPDGRLDVFRLTAPLTDARLSPLILAIELRGADGGLISSQWYPFNHQPKDEALRALESRPLDELAETPIAELLEPYGRLSSPLSSQPRTVLRARVEADAIVIENAGEHPAPVVLIDGFPHDVGDVLEDNAFGLRAGESRRVAYVASSALRIRVRAWNADEVEAG